MATRARAEVLADRIREAAVRLDTDAPRVALFAADVVVPCLLIGPPDFTWPTETPALSWTITALAGSPADAGTWDALEHLVALVDEALPIESATAGAYVLPSSGGQSLTLPCYRITYSETLP